VLSSILGQNAQRVEKLKKDSVSHKIPCYICDSVQQEISKKVKETSDFLGNVVRETMKFQLEECRKKHNIAVSDPMTTGDILALEDLFYYFYDSQKKTRVGLIAPIALIEEWAIPFLADILDKGIKMDIDGFLRELVKSLLKLTSEIGDLYDDLVTFQRGFVKACSVATDSRIVTEVEALGIHKPDSDHIASVIIHQVGTKEKTIFVTFDVKTILDIRDELRKRYNIESCDPLYALHHIV
jgi:hypothetical protein